MPAGVPGSKVLSRLLQQGLVLSVLGSECLGMPAGVPAGRELGGSWGELDGKALAHKWERMLPYMGASGSAQKRRLNRRFPLKGVPGVASWMWALGWYYILGVPWSPLAWPLGPPLKLLWVNARS